MTRFELIEQLQKYSTIFTTAAIYSIDGMVLSLRHGTAEITAGYMTLAGMYGACGCVAAMFQKSLEKTWQLPIK